MPEANHENLRTYRPELDALRFVAFFLVFLHHALQYLPSFATNAAPASALNNLAWHGIILVMQASAAGLPLFFALSAFLITSLLLEEHEHFATVHIRNFYLRRVLRIWPLYFLGLFIALAIAYFQHQPDDYSRFFWFFLLAGNIVTAVRGFTPNPMSLLWSISIEEQFYLIWPWAMKFLSRRKLFFFALLLIALSNATIFYLGASASGLDSPIWCNTLIQFQMFAVGILLALMHNHNAPSSPLRGAALGLLAPLLWLIAAMLFHAEAHTTAAHLPLFNCAGYALLALGAASILKGFSMLGGSAFPKAIVELGKISYGLYVYHQLLLQFVFFILLTAFVGAGLWALPIAVFKIFFSFILLIVVARASYRYFEKPFLLFKKRFETIHAKSA